MRLLRECRHVAGPAGRVVVALNTDEFVERYKGRRPVMDIEERYLMLRSCRFVDQVILNSGDEDAKPAILQSGCDTILHGDDWTGDAYLKQLGVTEEWLEKHEVLIEYPTYTPGISTTEVIARCVSRSSPPSMAATT